MRLVAVLAGLLCSFAMAHQRAVDYSAICNGRLTLTSAVPVSNSDVTNSTIYFTPYNGGQISLYTGSAWKIYSFSELSLSLGTLSNNTNYDLFIYANGASPSFDSPVAWAGDTTRATAIVRQDGVYVKSGTPTRRYIGTFRTVSTTTTEDSQSRRFLWNQCNRESRRLFKTNGSVTWSYNTVSWRAAAGDSSYAVHVVTGLAESQIALSYSTLALVSNSGGFVGVAENGTESSATGPESYISYFYGTDMFQNIQGRLEKIAPQGYTYYTATENVVSTNAVYFYGAYNGRMIGFIDS